MGSLGRHAGARRATGQPDDVVLSREKERLALCINSFSTAPGGVVAPLVDVGRGDRDEDYAGKDLKGAVVLGDADAGRLWRRAVARRARSASFRRRCRSTSTPIRPAQRRPRRATSGTSCSGAACPYDEAAQGLRVQGVAARGVARCARRSLAAPAASPVTVRVTVASTFSTQADAHAGRRNSRRDASGRAHRPRGARAGAGRERQRQRRRDAGRAGRRDGERDQGEEDSARRRARSRFSCSTRSAAAGAGCRTHPDDAKQVKYMFSLDMTGEDVAKTGGSFLVERWPDPGAVWERPWDPHTEWGRGNVRAESLKGDLINDLHLAVCARVAARDGVGGEDAIRTRAAAITPCSAAGHPVAAQLAFHRSLLPHELRHARQDQPGGNEERRRSRSAPVPG